MASGEWLNALTAVLKSVPEVLSEAGFWSRVMGVILEKSVSLRKLRLADIKYWARGI